MKKSYARVTEGGARLWETADGKLHRVDGPAFIGPDGSYSWWFNGKQHRIGGPAVWEVDGSQEWWVKGKCHREDGPACDYADGEKWWCLYDVEYDPLTWMMKVHELQEKRKVK